MVTTYTQHTFDFISDAEALSPLKKCAHCHEMLPFDQFYSNKKAKDQHASWCKYCTKTRWSLSSRPHQQQRKRTYVFSEQQRERARITTKIWKKNNPNKKRAENARYRTKHQERLNKLKREASAKYAHEHPEEYRIKRITYRRSPQGKASKRLARVRRRALVTHTLGTFTLQQFYARCEYYGWCCYLCGKELTPDTVTIEHRIPLSRQGTNWPANLAPSCRSCNSKKGTKTETEYRNRFLREVTV